MDKAKLIGRTLAHAARVLGFWAKGYRVYMLRGSNDTDGGELIAEEYELSRILRKTPELGDCRVCTAEDYYGVRILRIRRRT